MRLNKKSIFVLSMISALFIVTATYGLFLMNQMSQGTFRIFLLGNGEEVISDKDIVWYNWTCHEVKLTAEGLAKIEALTVPMSGVPFVIDLDGTAIYAGSFWVSISSMSYSGIIIDTSKIQDNIITIEKGYPSQEFFKGIDARNSPKISDFFQKIGKLTR